MLYLRNLAQKILISNLNNDVLSKLQIPQLKAEPDLNLAALPFKIVSLYDHQEFNHQTDKTLHKL